MEEQRGEVTLIPQKRLDPLLEARSILEGRACALAGGNEEYLCGAAAAARYYVAKHRSAEPDNELYQKVKSYSDAVGGEARDDCAGLLEQVFRPVEELEDYVLSNLDADDEFIKTYFYAPQDGLLSVGGIVSELRDIKISREEAAAYLFNYNWDSCDSGEGYERAERMTFDEFVRRTGSIGLPDRYRMVMFETVADWDSKRREIDGVIRRAAELVTQKEGLVQPIVDLWYEDCVCRLENLGCEEFLNRCCGIKLNIEREIAVIPSVVNFMSISLTMLPDEIKGLRRKVIENGLFAYGVLVELLRDFQQRKSAGQKLVGMLRALGDKQRFKIMTALLERPMYTSDIIKLTGLTAATVSHHMSELLGEGFVEMSDRGNRIINSVSREGCDRFIKAVEDLFRQGERRAGDRQGLD